MTSINAPLPLLHNSQLLNCPEFVPRQHYQKETGRYPAGMWMPPCCPCLLASSPGIKRRAGGMRTSPFYPSESAPGSPRAVTPVPTKTEEVSNLKTLPKGLSASLPDLDSETWIEVKKRPRPSPARSKVGEACPLSWILGPWAGECGTGIT